MRTAYIIVIGGALVVLGMLFYPTVHSMIGESGVTVANGFLPLTAAANTFLPYAFLAFIVYGIIKMVRR